MTLIIKYLYLTFIKVNTTFSYVSRRGRDFGKKMELKYLSCRDCQIKVHIVFNKKKICKCKGFPVFCNVFRFS